MNLNKTDIEGFMETVLHTLINTPLLKENTFAQMKLHL